MASFRRKLNKFGLRKCLHGRYLKNKAYLITTTVTNISPRFTYKMAAKTGGRRYETKLRHCHAIYHDHLLRRQ